MASHAPLYLGFDLSTQQLKALAVTSDLNVVYEAKFDFDVDATYPGIEKGVLTNDKEHEVYAPVSMWLQAIDVILQRLKDKGLDFRRVRGISGAGQQHGSVYWSQEGENLLRNLDSTKALEVQLENAFSHPYSPNWQDASTQKECDAFDRFLGSETALTQTTGSKAHHRFTGPQILRFRQMNPSAYQKTSRISLVSSFLASIFLGRVAPFDISDVCGMNLWDVKRGDWHDGLLELTAGDAGIIDLKKKLDSVPEDGGGSLGNVHHYFVERFGFNPECSIAPLTGDNPATILALPLRQNDAMVSLGTSTTFLMSTPNYKPDPAVHFFNHPTTAGLYMFMLCYKNGGLAREQVRDALNRELSPTSSASKSWEKFNEVSLATSPMGQKSEEAHMKIGLYFPRPEIVPNVQAGEWHYTFDPVANTLAEAQDSWRSPYDDARAIVESQLLSLRLRSKDLVESSGHDLPPQPRRVYLVGGGSQNSAIAKIAGEVLGGLEGVFKLDVGENACALGAAYKAVWAVERRSEQTFEDLIGERWDEQKFVQKIAEGYQEGVFERYGLAVEGFDMMEKQVLQQQGNR